MTKPRRLPEICPLCQANLRRIYQVVTIWLWRKHGGTKFRRYDMYCESCDVVVRVTVPPRKFVVVA